MGLHAKEENLIPFLFSRGIKLWWKKKRKVECLRKDNGGHCTCNEFNNFWNEYGIDKQ